MSVPSLPSARQSQASLSTSATHSQSQSMSHSDISLETLVTHLLASKRSLASISTVWRANEIVTSARSALEESVVLSARAGFLRSGISEQVKILRKVRGGIEDVYKDGQRDFKHVIRTLDSANSKLESTMEILRSTMVEATFRPENEDSRSLLDFVDEQGVETMRDALKESIRESKEAQTEFDSSILSFDDDLRTLKAAMKASPLPNTSQSHDDLSPAIASHLHTLESNAQEMAALLDSLVRHFDLCVNAIRHTEGGYAAVQKAASSQPPEAEPVSVSGVMSTENDPTTGESLSEEERKEMLDVLEKDAAQVEDVVMELREYLADMEAKHEEILEHVASLTTSHDETAVAYSMLEAVGARLSSYIIASHEFRLRWGETKLNIQEQLNELESMRIFYENYFSSYDSLILEVHRRKQSEDKVKTIMRKAMEQIDKVYEADMKEREGFRIDVGDYLPVDLWPGVNAPARKWEFNPVDEKEGYGSVPMLDRTIVEAAGRRERERQRNER
ncbi:kinase activator [Drepanopeziza brunnea f. sp. 'multigermtubi' MB_m1]|uniref:Autophagy-related protein 17 n=1 Tax=Marssonina brunnea f. sp. multigermtubi (strain MB_m1) TaxID=1072389 RepID=K1X8C5_MARBU|nr:kinase activator [Drepanopeziza brunnea f. sp. 'multigermtubi' MB_m1]EKD21307.1 kinase activator [Drepanopeziza brunnea f. sp. 'multigermtubi' MB_m1]